MRPIDSTDPRAANPRPVRGSPIIAVDLLPYVRRIGVTDSGAGPPPEIPTDIQFGAQALRIDGWERMVLRAHGVGTDAHGRPWPALVTQAIAFRARTFTGAAQRETDGSPDARARCIERMRTDGALAEALLRELEWTQRRLRDEGESCLATRLTELIDRVDRAGAQIRTFLGEQKLDTAEPPSASASAPVLDPDYRNRWPDVEPASRRLPQAVPATEATVGRTQRRARGFGIRLRVGRSSLVTIAAIAIAVAILVGLLPAGPAQPESSAIGLGPMFQRPAVVDASAVAGVVIVTVDEAAWRRLPEARRVAELAQLNEIARAAGHGAVQVRTTGGTILTAN